MDSMECIDSTERSKSTAGRNLRRVMLISTLVLILAGCSSIKVGYRFFDNAIRWKVNDYVSLTGLQSAELTKNINNFHRWHQTTQLPIYVSFLERKALQFEQAQLSPADFNRIYEETFAIAMVSVDELGDAITDMLLSLEERQIPQVIKKMEKKSAEEIKEDFNVTPKQRMVKRQNKMIKRLTKLVGRLNKEQLAMIEVWANALPIDKELRVERQDRFVADLSKLLNDRSNPARFKQGVMAQFKTPERFANGAYRQSFQKRKQLTMTLMSDLYNSMTSAQRTRLIASVKKYRADFLSLVPRA